MIYSFKVDPGFARVSSWAHDKIFKQLPPTDQTSWIAGGSLLKKYIANGVLSDIDVYFTNEADWEFTVKGLVTKGGIIKRDTVNSRLIVMPSTNYDKFTYQFDCVKKFYPSPEECIKNFDFTLCAIALDRDSNFYIHEDFQSDIAAKVLKINNPNRLDSSIYRVGKYSELGFDMSPTDFEKLVEAAGRATGISIDSGENFVQAVDRLLHIKVSAPSSNGMAIGEVFAHTITGKLVKDYFSAKNFDEQAIRDYKPTKLYSDDDDGTIDELFAEDEHNGSAVPNSYTSTNPCNEIALTDSVTIDPIFTRSLYDY